MHCQDRDQELTADPLVLAEQPSHDNEPAGPVTRDRSRTRATTLTGCLRSGLGRSVGRAGRPRTRRTTIEHPMDCASSPEICGPSFPLSAAESTEFSRGPAMRIGGLDGLAFVGEGSDNPGLMDGAAPG